MKRLSLCAYILLFAILPAGLAIAGTFDFGGTVANSTGFTMGGEPFALSQRDSANLWLQATAGEGFSFTTQGSYTFTLERPYLFDIDRLALDLSATEVARGPSQFRFSLGRLGISDFTSQVLSHRADGMSFDFQYPQLEVIFSLGYTGLLLKPTSAIFLSKADIADITNPNVFFATPRLLGLLQISVPAVLGQTITLSGVFQQDMRDTLFDLATSGSTELLAEGSTTFAPAKGGPVNTQYVGLGLGGPIFGPLYYNGYFYLQSGRMLAWNASTSAYGYAPTLAWLGGGGIQLYLTGFLSSVVGVKGLWASGDATANSPVEGSGSAGSSLFLPISRSPSGIVFSPQLSNMAIVEASYSLKPFAWLGKGILERLQTVVKGLVFFRPTIGAISEPGIDPSSQGLFLGSEADVVVNFRPLSDFGISFSGGVYFPANTPVGAFLASRVMQYKAGLDMSFSF